MKTSDKNIWFAFWFIFSAIGLWIEPDYIEMWIFIMSMLIILGTIITVD